jgi:CubicO group peptidase (beta-lactamase class C family)
VNHVTGAPYVPGVSTWATVRPEDAGFDPAKLAEATAFAAACETDWSRSIKDHLLLKNEFEPPPWNAVIGPVRDRGGQNGLVIRGGRIVAEWGESERVDMTFSVTKSFVSTCAGIAFDRGLIRDLHQPVREAVPSCPGFDTQQNAPITWHDLLQQTSEWEGTLWGKPDLIDRNRDVSAAKDNSLKGQHRALQAPGTHWEYNDVRVNQAALAIMHALQHPLPEVVKAAVMDPIGASNSWRWHGYDTSWTSIGGRRMQSVSGGGHWGGGLHISSRDLARFGLLFLRRGAWGNKRLLSEDWIARATTPCERHKIYGYMWWLNTDRAEYASAPASGFSARGAGTSLIWIDPEHDIVAVLRWIRGDAIDAFLRRLLAALN